MDHEQVRGNQNTWSQMKTRAQFKIYGMQQQNYRERSTQQYSVTQETRTIPNKGSKITTKATRKRRINKAQN